MRTENSKWWTHEEERTEALHRDGITRSSNEVLQKRTERRGDVVEPNSTRQPAMGGTDECGKALSSASSLCWELLQREPYELRGSRPVLRGRGGETPPRYSPVHLLTS
jgi:hypothetical protein